MGLGMYVPHVCIAPRKAVRHQLPYEAGEGGQQGGAGGGREETLQIGFYMAPPDKGASPFRALSGVPLRTVAGALPPEGEGRSLSTPMLTG